LYGDPFKVAIVGVIVAIVMTQENTIRKNCDKGNGKKRDEDVLEESAAERKYDH
jgi:hypothetical protein